MGDTREVLNIKDKAEPGIDDAWRVVEVGRLLLSVLNPIELQALMTEGDREEDLIDLNGDRIPQNLSPSAHNDVISILE